MLRHGTWFSQGQSTRGKPLEHRPFVTGCPQRIPKGHKAFLVSLRMVFRFPDGCVQFLPLAKLRLHLPGGLILQFPPKFVRFVVTPRHQFTRGIPFAPHTVNPPVFEGYLQLFFAVWMPVDDHAGEGPIITTAPSQAIITPGHLVRGDLRGRRGQLGLGFRLRLRRGRLLLFGAVAAPTQHQSHGKKDDSHGFAYSPFGGMMV